MAYQPLGKFGSALDELLYTLACHWDWAQDHDGNTQDFGCYAWKMGLERGEELSDWNLAMLTQEAERIDAEDTTLPDSIYGYWIVSEDGQGFVSVSQFETDQELEDAWEAYQDSYNQWAEESGDE